MLLNLPLAWTQPIFSEGKIITIEGDTLKGWVGEMGSLKNYNTCPFRATADATTQEFLPEAIKGYIIEDRRYFERQTVAPPGETTKTRFAEILIKGEVTLLKIEQEYYFKYADGEIRWVPFTDRYITANTEQKEVKAIEAKWIRFLHSISDDCAGMKTFFDQPKNLKYTKSNLVEIVKAYNQCKGVEPIEYGERLPTFLIDFGPAISVEYTGVDFFSDSESLFRYLTIPDYNDIGARFGIALLIRSTRTLSNFSFYVEPSVRYFNLNADALYIPDFRPDAIYYHTNIEWLGIHSVFAGRYTFPNMKPQLSLQFGPTIEFLSVRTNEALTESLLTEDGVDYVTTEFQSAFEFGDTQLGLSAQVNLSGEWNTLGGSWALSLGVNRGAGIADSDDAINASKDPIDTKMTTFFLKTAFLW
jgi:hypothetical protein